MLDNKADRLEIVIAEDDLTSRMVMEGFVAKLGYKALLAENGMQALQILQQPDAPMLALIDWEMPEMDGLEVIKTLRSDNDDLFRYLIMLTGKSARDEIIEGIRQGADDYITKPFDSKELEVRIRAGQRIVDLQRQLLDANRKLDELAQTDELTGFYNRLALHRNLKRQFEETEYSPPPATFIMVDIDHFKRVNDNFGHDAGDAVLKQFSKRVKKLLRIGDIVCRMGGEEFLIIAPETDETMGEKVAQRVLLTTGETPYELSDGQRITVTCSLGVYTASVSHTNENFDEQIKKADAALYQSKENGRNRVTVYQES